MAAIDVEKDPLIAEAVEAIVSAHYTIGFLAMNPDGFGAKSLEEMALSSMENLSHVLSLLGYSDEDVWNMQARITEDLPGGRQRRWEPYVDDDCPGNTPAGSK